ncbi:MAG: hypothetical protein RLZZ324_1023, partial [Candidatus Parcubacteria bacterium]
MKHLLIVTGNEKKFVALKAHILKHLPDMKLSRLDLDIPEPQTADPAALMAAKVAYVRTKTALPFIIDDMS